MKLIEEWLKSPNQNYIIGCSYYNTFGNDPKLKKYFATGETDFTKKKLIESLKELLTTSTISQKKVRDELAIMPIGTDAVTIALEKEWKEPYAKMNYLRATLDEFGNANDDKTKAKRFAIVEEIMQLEDKCNEIWNKRDGYVDNAELPTRKIKAVAIPTEPIALGRYIYTCARAIRKYHNKPGTNNAALFTKWMKAYKEASGKDYEFKN